MNTFNSKLPESINPLCFDSDSFRMSQSLVSDDHATKLKNRKIKTKIWFFVFGVAFNTIFSIIIYFLNLTTSSLAATVSGILTFLALTIFSAISWREFSSENYSNLKMNPVAGTKLCLLVDQIVKFSPAAKYIQQMVITNRQLLECDYYAMVHARNVELETNNSKDINEACVRIHAG